MNYADIAFVRHQEDTLRLSVVIPNMVFFFGYEQSFLFVKLTLSH